MVEQVLREVVDDLLLLPVTVVESLVKKSKQFIGTVPGTVVGTKTMACKHGIGLNIWQKDRYRRKAQVKVGNC